MIMDNLDNEIKELEKKIQKNNKKNIFIKESISLQKPFLKWVTTTILPH